MNFKPIGFTHANGSCELNQCNAKGWLNQPYKLRGEVCNNASIFIDAKQAGSVGLDLDIHRCQIRLTGGLSIVPLSRFVRQMPVPMPVSKGLEQPAQRSKWPKEAGLWVFQSSLFKHHINIVGQVV
jgi:hypothetical protein